LELRALVVDSFAGHQDHSHLLQDQQDPWELVRERQEAAQHLGQLARLVQDLQTHRQEQIVYHQQEEVLLQSVK